MPFPQPPLSVNQSAGRPAYRVAWPGNLSSWGSKIGADGQTLFVFFAEPGGPDEQALTRLSRMADGDRGAAQGDHGAAQARTAS